MKRIKQENKDMPSSKSKQGVQSSEIPRPESSKASCSNYGVFFYSCVEPMIQPSITVLYKLKQTLVYHKM